MDQGDDLANNKEIQAMLAYHRYNPRPTGGSASWKNAIGYQLTPMLYDDNLSFKIWPWAFNH
jgi:hypothetical protein